tara:strand:- start:2710 stop:3363 length:654 start_codon:yes stop_codon:yes gene_type:complete
MATNLNTTTVIPSVLTSTYKGHKASEVFVLNSDLREGASTAVTSIVGTTSDAGQFYAVNSDGWSELQLWHLSELADTESCGTYSVIGKRPFLSASFNDGNIQGSVFKALDESNVWFPCPVLSSSVINPGTDSDAAAPITPPAGCHQCGSMFTFDNHAGGVLDVTDTSVLISGTTRLFGGVTIDVRGTKEITVVAGVDLSGGLNAGDAEGYILGQFVA